MSEMNIRSSALAFERVGVGAAFRAVNYSDWEVVFIKGGTAFAIMADHPEPTVAYGWDRRTGKSISLGAPYDVASVYSKLPVNDPPKVPSSAFRNHAEEIDAALGKGASTPPLAQTDAPTFSYIVVQFGEWKQVKADGISIEGGHLTLYAGGLIEAAFPSGSWLRVVRVDE